MIVVDSSVALKWVRKNEGNRKLALHLLEKHKNLEDEILVPDLLYTECANTLATKPDTTPYIIRRSLSIIFKSELKLYVSTQQDITKAALWAKKYNTSVYDMLYAVIAKKKKIQLITADEKFVEKTKFKFVKLLKDFKAS